MNKEPLVSVIMNCYNGRTYLGKVIYSVFSKICKNWEIIFWDNPSNYYSEHIAKSYDTKLTYFSSKKNTVLVAAVNEANGEYLTFINCNDFWNREKANDY